MSERGGYIAIGCDDLVRQVVLIWPAFEFQAIPVTAVESAIHLELGSISLRDALETQ